MAEQLRVEGKVEKGAILLTIRYGEELMLERDAPEQLSTALKERYREIREKEKVETTSCVVDIQSEIVGSPLVRALFELWKEVVGKKEGEGGQVICVNYPQDYIDSLTSLGLSTLEGFNLAGTVDEAIRNLVGKFGK